MTKYAYTGLFFFPTGTRPHRKPSLGRESDLSVPGKLPADWAAGPELGRIAPWLDWGGTDGAEVVRGVGGETQTQCGTYDGLGWQRCQRLGDYESSREELTTIAPVGRT